jgi:hypothetical protein
MKYSLFLSIAILVMGMSCFSAGAVTASAQQREQDDSFKKERRIFLWDVTISMVGATHDASCPKGTKRTKPDFDYAKSGWNYNQKKDIFDATRKTLIDMVMQVQKESTEIIILPFRNEIVGEFKANATAAGKNQLRDQIMNWNGLQSGGTYTATCLQKAVNYFTQDRINKLILLTDGEPSDNEGSKLLNFLQNWKGNKETQGSGNHLVYVMLTDEANGSIGSAIEDLAKYDSNIIVVPPGTDIGEMVFISVGPNASIYVRDYFDGKLATNGKGSIEIPCISQDNLPIPDNSVFHFSIEENEFVEINPAAPVKVVDGKFVIPITLKKSFEDNLATLPSASDLTLVATCSKDATCSDLVEVSSPSTVISLVMKVEPRVTISWSTKE